jgi:endo-1,4-beta-xylanase
MQNRRLAAAFAVVASAALAGSLALVRPADAASSLKQSAEAKSKYFGTALVQSNLNNSTLVGVATAQFDMMTPGNEMKWDTTEPSNGSFNFGPGDALVAFAQAHSMRVRGHNLVWHSQLPG